MPPITTLLHTMNDALRLGRTLKTLLPCAELLIVDADSTDTTRNIASVYGARIVAADAHSAAKYYLDLARHDWILCIRAGESITESLQASLFEWTALPAEKATGGLAGGTAFYVFVRQQTGKNWLDLPAPETRLIPRNYTNWHGKLPTPEPWAIALEGEPIAMPMILLNLSSTEFLTRCPFGQ